MNLISIDVETECGMRTCDNSQCTHALDPAHNRISCVGLWCDTIPAMANGVVVRNLPSLLTLLPAASECVLVSHNIKFDIRTLLSKGIDLTSYHLHDTSLMASVFTQKVSESFLTAYERQRKEENKKLKKGYSHRKAKGLSLKTLAPYFLGVKAFWENPENHNDDTYVLTDARYTLQLFRFLEAQLKAEDTYPFYERLRGWARTILQMEIEGISIDIDLLNKEFDHTKARLHEVRAELDNMWREAYIAYFNKEADELDFKYLEMRDKAVSKIKSPTPEKIGRITERYRMLCHEAKEKLSFGLNLDSPKQLQWLFRDYFKLDITDFNGDESTGITVLQKLARTRADIKLYLEYRKLEKLATAFFPSYLEKNVNGVMHCTYNMGGTRTGRLSSSGPNLQQVARGLHKLFISKPGYMLATYDMAAIEPRLIAYYSEDPILFDIIAKGHDFHGYNTKILFRLDCDVSEVKHQFEKERKVGKELGLAMMYGAGPRRIQESAQKYGFFWNLSECREKYQAFKEEFEYVFKFKEALDERLEAGEVVRNLLGRPYKLDKKDVYMKGLNTLIQSSGSDLVIQSAHILQDWFNNGLGDGSVKMLIHDEIVCEVPETEAQACVKVIERALTNYNLTTSLGPVKLAVEGKVSKCWEK